MNPVNRINKEVVSLDQEITQSPNKPIDDKTQTVAKGEFTLRFQCTSSNHEASYVTLSTTYLKEIYKAYLLNTVEKPPQKHEDIISHLLSRTKSEDQDENTYAELAHIPKGMFPKFFTCLKDLSFLKDLKPADLIIIMHMANWFSLDDLVNEAGKALEKKTRRLEDKDLKEYIKLEKKYPCESTRDLLEVLEFERATGELTYTLAPFRKDFSNAEKTQALKQKVVDDLLYLGKLRLPKKAVSAVENPTTNDFVFNHEPIQQVIQALVDNFSSKELQEMWTLFSKESKGCAPIFQSFMNIPLKISQDIEKIQGAFRKNQVDSVFYGLNYIHKGKSLEIKAGQSKGEKVNPYEVFSAEHDTISFEKYKDVFLNRAISYRLSSNDRIILSLIELCGPQTLAFASTDLQHSRTFALKAVQIAGRALWHVSYTLKMDQEVVYHAVMNDPTALEFAAENVKKNRQFMHLLLGKQPACFPFIDDALKKDIDFLLVAIASNHEVLKYMGVLNNNKRFVIEALRRNARAFQWISEPLKKDPQVLAAHKQRLALEASWEKARLKSAKQI